VFVQATGLDRALLIAFPVLKAPLLVESGVGQTWLIPSDGLVVSVALGGMKALKAPSESDELLAWPKILRAGSRFPSR